MKKMIIASVWLAVIALWAGIGVYYLAADPALKEWTVAVTAGAVGLEAAFWTTAAVLGMSLFESRKAALRFLTRPFGGKA